MPGFLCRTLAGAVLLALTGCETAHDCSLTYKLWTNDRLRHYYEPASNPHLQLFYDPKRGDVLAAYDEAHENRETTKRRAYFVNRNRERLDARRKPRFVSPQRALSLAPIPLVQSAPVAATDSATFQAVVAASGQEFTLSGNGGNHTFGLPVYADHSGTAGRVAFSPFAIAGDVVMVGIVTGVVAAYLYACGGSYYQR